MAGGIIGGESNPITDAEWEAKVRKAVDDSFDEVMGKWWKYRPLMLLVVMLVALYFLLPK